MMVKRTYVLALAVFVGCFLAVGGWALGAAEGSGPVLKSTKMSIFGFEGTLQKVSADAAVSTVLAMKIGKPPFLKTVEEMAGCSVVAAVSGTLKHGKDAVRVFKLKFGSEEQAVSVINLERERGPEDSRSPLKVEDPRNMRNRDFGLFFDGRTWTGFRRQGDVLALMKGAVSQEAMFHMMEEIFPVEEAAEAPSAAPIKIGLIGTMSGLPEWQGMDLRDGALLALKSAAEREEYAGHRFELVVADDRGVPEVAAAEARRLIEQEGVAALVGPVDSDCALAVAPVVTEAQVPMITLSTLPELTDPLKRYVFRGTVSDAVLGRLMADYTKIMLGGGRIAILYEQSAYGRSGMEVVAERLRRVGVEPVAVESYSSGAKDFSAQMELLKAADPGNIIVYGGMQDAQSVMQAIRGAGLACKVVASSGWASTHLLPQVPLGLDGVVVAGYTHMVPDALFYLSPARIVLSPVARGHYQVVTSEPDQDMFPWWTPFFTAFRGQYGRNPDLYAGYGYSNLLCLLAALERVQFDQGRLVEALEGTENFETVFGHLINYHDECHDGMQYTNFSTYRDGRVQLATKDKSLDATKMREGGLKVETAGYRGQLYALPPNTAAYFVIHMHYGYPRFMKETQQMGLYGGFRSEYNFYGMKYAYSGTLHKGQNQIMMVKLSFRKAERAQAILDLESTKENLEGKTEIEKRPEEFRNPQEGVSYAQGLWSAYKRSGGTIVFAKGEVPLEDIKAAMDAAL